MTRFGKPRVGCLLHPIYASVYLRLGNICDKCGGALPKLKRWDAKRHLTLLLLLTIVPSVSPAAKCAMALPPYARHGGAGV